MSSRFARKLSYVYRFCAPISSPMKNIGVPAESRDKPKHRRDRASAAARVGAEQAQRH